MPVCKLCGGQCEERSHTGPPDLKHLDCARCGNYIITDDAYMFLDSPEEFLKEHVHLLSAVTRSSWCHGVRFRVDLKLVEDRSEFEARVLSQCPRGVQEKMNVVLRHIAQKSESPGHSVRVQAATDYVHVYCKDRHEMALFIDALINKGLLDPVGPGKSSSHVRVSASGWAKVEELGRPNIESKQVFVAMWFDEQLNSAYVEGIVPLEEATGFRMVRIDMKQFNEKICDRIIAEIRGSRFLIADVTGHRQGVYFEAGYAMGLGLPVIWTCRKDHIDECHFDTRQYNHITWETPEELGTKLRDRILATVGRAGP